MDNDIVVRAPKAEGEIDVTAHAWRFNTAKSLINCIENNVIYYKKKYHHRRTTAKRLSTSLSVADKTALLIGVVAGSFAVSWC